LLISERYDPTKPSSARAGNDKYFVYDVALSLNPEFKVFTFPFEPKEKKATSKGQSQTNQSKAKKRFRSPKKLLLSPNKRLLLIHGAVHRGQSCLLV